MSLLTYEWPVLLGSPANHGCKRLGPNIGGGGDRAEYRRNSARFRVRPEHILEGLGIRSDDIKLGQKEI